MGHTIRDGQVLIPVHVFGMWGGLCSGGLRLKRDVSEYAEYVRSFDVPSIDEKFEVLGT